jgi:hypothetical protein
MPTAHPLSRLSDVGAACRDIVLTLPRRCFNRVFSREKTVALPKISVTGAPDGLSSQWAKEHFG